jgi:hypothetical protein
VRKQIIREIPVEEIREGETVHSAPFCHAVKTHPETTPMKWYVTPRVKYTFV